jgi:hypothetical protein
LNKLVALRPCADAAFGAIAETPFISRYGVLEPTRIAIPIFPGNNSVAN